MSGLASRRKGIAGEREVVELFRAAGFDCDRVPNSGGLRFKGDLYGNLPVHVEVKRYENWRMQEWIRQAEADAGERTPIVAARQSRGRWYATLPLDALLELLRDRAT